MERWTKTNLKDNAINTQPRKKKKNSPLNKDGSEPIDGVDMGWRNTRPCPYDLCVIFAPLIDLIWLKSLNSTPVWHDSFWHTLTGHPIRGYMHLTLQLHWSIWLQKGVCSQKKERNDMNQHTQHQGCDAMRLPTYIFGGVQYCPSPNPRPHIYLPTVLISRR